MITRDLTRLFLLTLFSIWIFSAIVFLVPAQAIPLSINNASFESTVLALDNAAAGAPGSGAISDWTITAGFGGVWYIPDTVFPGGAADGNNVAFFNGPTTISQTLVDVLQPNTLYDLSSVLGERDEFNGTGTIALFAGGSLLTNATVDFNGISADSYVPTSAQFTTTNSHSQLGQQLSIQLSSTGTGRQVLFDKIQLEAQSTSVPVPSTLLLFGAGFAGFTAWRWREEKLQ